MCIIIPIDHATCAHTVALWQHCANAPRSLFGHKPCSHIRQHSRPILTRKRCHNCGGPRFFARRGGLAARGNGSAGLDEVKEEDEEENEQYDSGYQSDLMPEADDQDEHDELVSPRQTAASTWRAREFATQPSSHAPRSSNYKSSWRPNLKRDLSTSSSSTSSSVHSYPSIDSTMSRSEREETRSFRARLSYNSVKRLAQSLAPVIRSPSPRRKSAAFLTPSLPPFEPSEDGRRASTISYQDITPPATPPDSLAAPSRKGSTLLHPSTPQERPVSNVSADVGFPFTLNHSPVTMEAPAWEPLDAPELDHIGVPRKNSTLLHPSSPSDDESPAPFTAKTIISLPPTPQGTPTAGCFKRCPSALSSNSSDDDWEEPLHSSHSDVEYDSDDDPSATAFAPHRISLKTARVGQTVRASRVSLHGN